LFQTRPWSDQGWICQRSGYADQAARLQPPKAKPAESRFIGLSPLAGELQSERRKKGGIYIYIYVYSKEVWKSNFRQYGQMKSRAGKRQREEED